MLACIQRQQNFSSQHLACTPKSFDVSPSSLLLPVPPLQACTRKGEPGSMISRYPSPAELDAFAQKTANSPLTIKIFPSDVRVPQHKQLSKTVNGLDTTGQRYSPYSHPHTGGYQGLLAVVKASVVVKGVLKSSEGRRTKHMNSQTSVAPYNNPLNNSCTVRHRHEAYNTSSCKPPDVPIEALCSTAGIASRDQSLAPQPELAEVQSLMRRMSRVPHSQAPQLGGEARASPSLQAVAAVAHSESDFVFGVPPQSSRAFAGAVLPTQSADMAKTGYLEREDYAVWQHKAQMQPYLQEAVGMYGVSNGTRSCRTGEAGVSSPETRLPLPCSSQLPYRQHLGNVGAAVTKEQTVKQYFAPLWDNSSSDGYSSQVMGPNSCASRPRHVGVSHPHLHLSGHQPNQPQLHPPVPPHHFNQHVHHLHHHAQAYSTEQNLSCGLPTFSLCHARVLSSSLQSLECLISEIQPPCIKERMLGRGYEAIGGMPPLLEHQQHMQLPVYR
ncbi:protein FAM222A-like isoform 1-T3 [Fundulus diaphanus]